MGIKKIGALIPIRLASERLPQKAILKICGKPIVHHLLDRAFDSKYLEMENVIVCTTKESSDDPLVSIVENYGAKVFRGDTDDIIKRFYDAMVYYNLDYAIQIDGDDITAEPEYMDLTMETLLSDSKIDVVSVTGLPLGVSTKSFSFKAMGKVFNRYKTTNNDTGFGSLFTETDFCNHVELKPKSNKHEFEKVRLTLDYQKDLELFDTIFKELYEEGRVFHLEEMINLFYKKPEIPEINFYLQEEYMDRWHEKRQVLYEGIDGEIKKI